MGKSLFPLEMFEKYFTQVCKEQILLLGTKIMRKNLDTSWLEINFTLWNFKMSSKIMIWMKVT